MSMSDSVPMEDATRQSSNERESVVGRDDELDDLGNQFSFPSFSTLHHNKESSTSSSGEPVKEVEEEKEEEEPHPDTDTTTDQEIYTLDSSALTHNNPVLLTATNHTSKSTSSSKRFVSRLKRFTLSNPTRKNSLASSGAGRPTGRSNTLSNIRNSISVNNVFQNLADIERYGSSGGHSDIFKEQEIADHLVKLHNNNNNTLINQGDDSLKYETDPYVNKEEYDEELNDVNGKLSEIPHNVQTGILSSLLKLYGDDTNGGVGVGDDDDDSEDELISQDGFEEELAPTKSMVEFDKKLPNRDSNNELDRLKSRFNRKLKEEARSLSPLNMKLRNILSHDDESDDDNDNDNLRPSKSMNEIDELRPSKSTNELDNLRSRFNKKFKSEVRGRSPLNIRPSDFKRGNNKSSSSIELPNFQKRKQPKKNRLKKLTHHKSLARARITVHIANILNRQKFILKLCKAFMLYGAPTHRLEEYLISSLRVLEMDANFVYLPGVMLVSFGDAMTRTTEMHVVRVTQGLNLSKLYDAHIIYKKVMHDMIGVYDAIGELDSILLRRMYYNSFILILNNGLASLFITSWGFRGGWRDMPISFVLGGLVGFLQIIVSPKSNTYSQVFEVSSSVVVAFVSRAFGSIGSNHTFCFSAITQSALVSILPGYTILCGSLELQSRNMVSGAVRMFYAIIYSLFLGFGIILGSALYKWVDSSATSETTCPTSVEISNYYRILFVPLFACTQLISGQARISQLPVMLFISCVTYVGYYFASLHFSSSAEFSLAIGAFIVGILGNLYSRVGQGLAVSAMYPGVLLLVPGSIGLKSSLTSGVSIADAIVAGQSTVTSVSDNSLSFGIAMIEVAIGLCVGLIGAALIVYPLGKKRTGLFTL